MLCEVRNTLIVQQLSKLSNYILVVLNLFFLSGPVSLLPKQLWTPSFCQRFLDYGEIRFGH